MRAEHRNGLKGEMLCKAKNSGEAKDFFRGLNTAKCGDKKRKADMKYAEEGQQSIQKFTATCNEATAEVEDAFVSFIASCNLAFAVADRASFKAFCEVIRKHS